MEPPPPPPDPPDMDRVRVAQARIGAHGSAEVQEILKRWSDARVEVFLDADTLRPIREASPHMQQTMFGIGMGEQYRKVEEKRQEMREIARELRVRVNAELGERGTVVARFRLANSCHNRQGHDPPHLGSGRGCDAEHSSH